MPTPDFNVANQLITEDRSYPIDVFLAITEGYVFNSSICDTSGSTALMAMSYGRILG